MKRRLKRYFYLLLSEMYIMKSKKYDLIFGILLILLCLGYFLLPEELWNNKFFIGIYTFLLLLLSISIGIMKRKATKKERKNELDAIITNNDTEALRKLLKRSIIIFTIISVLFAFGPIVCGVILYHWEWEHWILSAASVLCFGIAVRNFLVYRKLNHVKNIEKRP